MSTRKIIDPKQNGEKVWLKGHAQATFMSDGSTVEQQIAGKMDKVTLAPIATSGNYDDLSNKPTIPNAVTESTVSGWGFTKNTGTYSKPSTGIPKSDLASDIQTSLDKANTALQSYTEQYKGTVTGVKINGSTKSPSSGVVDLGTVITSHQDISGKQDKLVSSTNIKTINGESILGEGNLTVTTEANIQAVDTTDEIEDVETNTYVKYVAQTLTDEQKAQVRENIGVNNQCTVDLSNYYTKEEIDSQLGDINTILEYIINGVPNIITFTISGYGEYQAEEGMTWEEWVNSDYNSLGFVVSENYIQNNQGEYIVLVSAKVLKNQVITANEKYLTEQKGMSGGS